MSDPNKNLIQRLKAQIAVAKDVDGDFVYITVGDAKRILKVLDRDPEEELNNFERLLKHCDSAYTPCEDVHNAALKLYQWAKEGYSHK